MNMIKYTVVFLLGVFVGQEYGVQIPNVKSKTVEYYNQLTNTEFYKKIRDDFNKKK
jgi:hypothetical protein